MYACNLNVVPLRREADHRSEMVSQVLFGERFEILERGDYFDRIKLIDTSYEGWIQHGQYDLCDVTKVENAEHFVIGTKGATAICNSPQKEIRLFPGTHVYGRCLIVGGAHFYIEGDLRRPSLEDFSVELAVLKSYYLDAPYMWGGRTISGIDCSGLSQAIYAHFGISLLRDAWQQAESGVVVDFLPEIVSGDLAFFDNEKGHITHVGIMLDSEKILHASGMVRMDRLDSEGIFNADIGRYTHKLCIVKRYF